MKKMKDDRITYIIPPGELLLNVKKAFEKTGLKIVEESVESLSWSIRGQKQGLVVEVKLNFRKEKVKKLEILGEIFINKLEMEATGEDSLVDRFRWNFEVSLLRCLG